MDQRPLHWSERAKMYPSSSPAPASGGSTPPQQPVRPARSERKPQARTSSRKGLWITIAVVLCAAAAAAAIFFWYLPGRDTNTTTVTSANPSVDAQTADRAAATLVHSAMTAIESAYVDLRTYDPATMTAAQLSTIEPSITFILSDSLVDAAQNPKAQAAESAVDYFGGAINYAVGTTSASGTTLGVMVNKGAGGGNTWYIDGMERDWGEVFSPTTLNPYEGVDATSAADAAAKSLLRNGMTAMESAYVDLRTFDPATMTPEVLTAIEPSITFVAGSGATAATVPTALATHNAVNYSGTTTGWAVGTVSAWGNTFGATVDHAVGPDLTYYVNGQVGDWNAAPGSTNTTALAGGTVPAIVSLFSDPAFGCSFEYPSSWVEFPLEEASSSSVPPETGIAVCDPLGGFFGTTPNNYIMFAGNGATDGETAPSARSALEEWAATTEAANEASIPGSVETIEPVTDFEVNGIPAAAKTQRLLTGDRPIIMRIVFLTSGERVFVFVFSSEEQNYQTNRLIFDATLDSFRAMATEQRASQEQRPES